MVRNLINDEKIYSLGVDVQGMCVDFTKKFPEWWKDDEVKIMPLTVRGAGRLKLQYSRQNIRLDWANSKPTREYDVYTLTFTERGTKDETVLMKVASFPESRREKEIVEGEPMSNLIFRQKTTSGYTDTTVYYHGGGYWRDGTIKSSYLILELDPIFGKYTQALNSMLKLAEPEWFQDYFDRVDGKAYERHYYCNDVPYNLLHPSHRYWINMSNVHYDGMQRLVFPQLQISNYMTPDIKNVLKALYTLESQVYRPRPDKTYSGPNIRKFLWDTFQASSCNLMGMNEAFEIMTRAAHGSLKVPSSHSLEDGETDTTWAYMHHDMLKVEHSWLMALYYSYLSRREEECPLFRLINASMVWLPPLDELNEIYSEVEKFVNNYNQENLLNEMGEAHGTDKTKIAIKYTGIDL